MIEMSGGMPHPDNQTPFEEKAYIDQATDVIAVVLAAPVYLTLYTTVKTAEYTLYRLPK